jgi:hypothetical protein
VDKGGRAELEGCGDHQISKVKERGKSEVIFMFLCSETFKKSWV